MYFNYICQETFFFNINSVITLFLCSSYSHKRPQPVISTPYDFCKYGKIGEIFKVVFTGVKF